MELFNVQLNGVQRRYTTMVCLGSHWNVLESMQQKSSWNSNFCYCDASRMTRNMSMLQLLQLYTQLYRLADISNWERSIRALCGMKETQSSALSEFPSGLRKPLDIPLSYQKSYKSIGMYTHVSEIDIYICHNIRQELMRSCIHRYVQRCVCVAWHT